ncbi:MAG: cytochrome c-type biogenesis protein [Cellvibrionaceae bacterium]
MFVFDRLLMLFVALNLSVTAIAAVDIYEFDTESQRYRYHVLVEELRCPKCQNQNLSGSNSEIAADLRRELHRLLVEGKTDREIKDFMVARYGDFVLYKPPLKASTIMLWAFPILLVVIGVIVLTMVVRQRRAVNTNDQSKLSEEDVSKLNNLLDQTKENSP